MSGLPGSLRSQSLVFRLWLALNAIFLVAAAGAAFVYLRGSINEEINEAHSEIAVREETLIVYASMIERLVRGEGTFRLTETDFYVLQRLGVYRYDLFRQDGRPLLQINPDQRQVIASPEYLASLPTLPSPGPLLGVSVVSNIVTEPASEEALAAAREQRTLSRTVSMEQGQFSKNEAEVSILGVLTGESYAAEAWFSSDQGFAQRTFIAFPDLTTGARTAALLALLLIVLAVAATSITSWILFQRMISRPLRQYSGVALAIAAGEPTRMPINGGSELEDLARAINSMADILENKASVDSLTGLYNLRHMSSRLESLVQEALDAEQPLSVLVLDLDRFKPVNDTYGHAAGDIVLRVIADTVREWAAREYVCWRQGGDEFVVAMPGLRYGQALKEAAQLQEIIANQLIPIPAGTVRLTISIGVATLPEDGRSAGSLIGVADRQMYQNKADRIGTEPWRLSA